ncbi:hypothetical protein IHE44_0010206, partial [Lamprotornis superbus]
MALFLGVLVKAAPVALAWMTPSTTIAVGGAGDVKAPGADGHSTTAEDAANGSRGGGSHHGVLWEGAEDGARQGHQHSRRLNGNDGALALPDTALIAAVGQRAGAAGLAARNPPTTKEHTKADTLCSEAEMLPRT